MKWFSPKMLVVAGLSVATLGTGALGMREFNRPALVADSVLAQPAIAPQSTILPLPAATTSPAPSPIVPPAPTATPAPVIATTAKFVAAVAPVQKTSAPACQSQTYDAANAQACPRSAAPPKQVSLAALANPATSAAALPPVPSAVAVTPAPTVAPTTNTPMASTAPAAAPHPTSVPVATMPAPASSACGGGYPSLLCDATQDSLVDPWGMYNRECVSYTAFRVSNSGRKMPYWGGRGNAKQWPDNARAAGILVDGTPQMGDVAVSLAGTWGHTMYVEEIVGTRVIVSQYNYGGKGEYSTMNVPAAGLSFIHFR